MFLALLLPLCGDRLQLATALSAALFSLLFTMAGAGRGSIILAAAAAATVGLFLSRRKNAPRPPGAADIRRPHPRKRIPHDAS